MNYFTDMLFTKLRNNSLNIRVFRQCFDMLKDRCHKSCWIESLGGIRPEEIQSSSLNAIYSFSASDNNLSLRQTRITWIDVLLRK